MCFLLKEPIILASSSPRRRGILELAHIHFEIVKPSINEERPFQIPALRLPEFLAKAKARHVYQQTKTDKIILAADTVVYVDNQLVGKPVDRKEALEMLRRLSGRTHSVITGVALYRKSSEECFSDETKVTFHPLSDEEIAYYVDRYKPYDKAGGYSVHEWMGLYGVHSIQGDYYNVLGLPISRTVRYLVSFARRT